MDDELLTKLKWLIDRTEIFDLVRYERFCRDQRDWKGLIDSFVPNSRVRTTWFDGPVEEFADASRRKMNRRRSERRQALDLSNEITDQRATSAGRKPCAHFRSVDLRWRRIRFVSVLPLRVPR